VLDLPGCDGVTTAQRVLVKFPNQANLPKLFPAKMARFLVTETMSQGCIDRFLKVIRNPFNMIGATLGFTSAAELYKQVESIPTIPWKSSLIAIRPLKDLKAGTLPDETLWWRCPLLVFLTHFADPTLRGKMHFDFEPDVRLAYSPCAAASHIYVSWDIQPFFLSNKHFTVQKRRGVRHISAMNTTDTWREMVRSLPEEEALPGPMSGYSDKTSLGSVSHRTAYPFGVTPAWVREKWRRSGRLLALVGLLPVLKLPANVNPDKKRHLGPWLYHDCIRVMFRDFLDASLNGILALDSYGVDLL
jgi:hypothetical protein